MREILLALILAGACLQISAGTEQQEKEDSDVKYNGPVVYTNLPPPLLYFPNFPEKPKFSNRGSSGDTEDKRVEYVPFPYKDLPLLVYQSESQPPVHVVEKGQNSEKDDQGQPGYGSSYQTGPAVYSDQHTSEQPDPMNQPQSVMTANDKYMSVGQIPSIDVQNQQYISIGVTSIQPQGSDDAQSQPSYPQQGPSQQTSGMYSQMQYASNQDADAAPDYHPQSVETSGQGGSGYMYYPAPQVSTQNVEPNQAPIVPVEQLTQAIKNYLIQHNYAHQQAQQTLLSSYPVKQDSYAQPPSEKPPAQHVGITIIRQPPVQDAPENDAHEPQYSEPAPPAQMGSGSEGYDDNQQYVSIGVFPLNVPGQETQQYYNLMAPVSQDQYQGTSDDYRQASQEKAPPMAQNENAQTAGYQLISIDLSPLRNQKGEQQVNTYSEYQKPVQRPPPASPPPKPYRPQNDDSNSYKSREKEFQQILIQIPENILSKQEEKPSRGKGQYKAPYTGTAQVTNVITESNKSPSTRPAGNMGTTYNRPPQQRPPPRPSHSERPRTPNAAFGFPQTGMISNGINIAIIKQTDSSNNSPVYKPPENRPISHYAQLQASNHPVIEKIPPPPNYSQVTSRPVYGFPNQQTLPSNTPRLNYERETLPVGSHSYALPTTRYHSYQSVSQYRNKPIVKNLGGHPGIYASSNLHYTTVNPTFMRPSLYGGAFSMSPQVSFAQASATKNHPHYVQSPVAAASLFSSPTDSETVLQAYTDNVPNGFGEANFDDINAFLNPSYDLFGSLTSGADKKKVEAETKLLQKVTSDLFTHDLNAVSLAGAIPTYNIVKPPSPPPPAHIQSIPFPYKYWEQPPPPPPMMHLRPPPMMVPGDRTRFMRYYSHMQHPYVRGRPYHPSLGQGKEKQRGIGKGYRGLRSKLAALRTSFRHKSKIASRRETTGEESIPDTNTLKAAPRSTIIQTEGPGLDGISIPLIPDHVLSSRSSSAEGGEIEKDTQMPPIIVYKGTKPPIEIYGSRADIEAVQENKTQTMDNQEKKEDPHKVSQTDKPETMSSQKMVQTVSRREGSDDYINYMYSMLPDFFTNSFSRRQDAASDKWLPVNTTEYALAEDVNRMNETSSEKDISPVPQHSSTNAEATIEENIEELFTLLGKVEKSDLSEK